MITARFEHKTASIRKAHNGCQWLIDLMREPRRHFTDRGDAGDMRQLLQASLGLALCLLAQCHVSNRREHEFSVPGFHRTQADLNRNLTAILALRD